MHRPIVIGGGYVQLILGGIFAHMTHFAHTLGK